MNKSKLLYWLPRVLGILYVLFISIFALDVFGEGLGLWGTALALFMHLIPSYILAAMLVIAWKFKKTGALIFLASGVVLLILYLSTMMNRNNGMVAAWALQLFTPLFIIGLLFLYQPNLKK